MSECDKLVENIRSNIRSNTIIAQRVPPAGQIIHALLGRLEICASSLSGQLDTQMPQQLLGHHVPCVSRVHSRTPSPMERIIFA